MSVTKAGAANRGQYDAREIFLGKVVQYIKIALNLRVWAGVFSGYGVQEWRRGKLSSGLSQTFFDGNNCIHYI